MFKKDDPKTQELARLGGETGLRGIVRVPADDLAYFFENKGVKGVVELLEKAFRGEPLNDSQKLYLKYFEKYMPYFKPKLASIDQKLPPEVIELFKVYLPQREAKKDN